MFAAATLAILVTLALAIIRAILGPTVFDRAQAGNTTGTMAVMLLAVPTNFNSTTSCAKHCFRCSSVMALPPYLITMVLSKKRLM